MRNVKPMCRESGACCGAIRGRGWRVLTIVFSSMRPKAAFSSSVRLACVDHSSSFGHGAGVGLRRWRRRTLASYARRSATIRSPPAIMLSDSSLSAYSEPSSSASYESRSAAIRSAAIRSGSPPPRPLRSSASLIAYSAVSAIHPLHSAGSFW